MAVELLEGRRLMAAAGLDRGFGVGGVVTTPLGVDLQFAGKAVQPDGKTVLCGYTHRADGPTGRDFAVARLNADGSLDKTFGTGGVVVTDLRPTTATGATWQDEASAVAVEPDGGLVVVGTSRYLAGGQRDVFSTAMAVRYTAQGQPDAAFGAADRAVTHLPAGAAAAFVADATRASSDDQFGTATSVVIDPAGDIVVGGSNGGGTFRSSPYVQSASYLFAWLKPDGTADPAHAGTTVPGLVLVDAGAGRNPVAFMANLPDGGYVAMGGYNQGYHQFSPPYAFGVVRFDAEGTPTPLAVTPLPLPAGGDAVAPLAGAVGVDGKLVVAGTVLSGTTRATARTSAVVVRYADATGTALDPTFGTGGLVTVPGGRFTAAVSMGVAANGGVTVLLATAASLAAADAGRASESLLRLTATGAVDPTFASHGSFSARLPPSSAAGTNDDAYGTGSPAHDLLSVDAAGRATVFSAGRSAVRLLRTVRDGVDVTAGRLTVAARVRSGGATVAVLTLADAGSAPAAGAATVRLTLVPTVSAAATTVDVPQTLALRPGQSGRVRLSFRLPAGLASGAYTLTATVLPAAAVGDADASDNLTAPVPVGVIG